MAASLPTKLLSFMASWSFTLATLIRLVLMFYGEYQDANFQVKYTDVDYKVYTDASDRVYNGESPFRYSFLIL